jgi:hypothetical protein
MKRTWTTLLAALAVQTAAAALCLADTNYGDFQASDCVFKNVIESSLTNPFPLFDSPVVSGGSLIFNPANFNSFVQGDNSAMTDGHLVVDITANAGQNITTVSLTEKGSYALTGNGTTDTCASVSAPVVLTILQVNGVGISQVTVTGNIFPFSPDGLEWSGGASSGPWQGNLVLDVTAALRANGISSGYATEVKLSLDNVLTTQSEVGTSAGIYKTEADITAPEPATISLLAAGITMIFGAARRKRIK